MKRYLFLIFVVHKHSWLAINSKIIKNLECDQKELANAKITLKGTETAGDAALSANAELVAGATDPTSVATADGATGLAINTFDFLTTTLTVPQQNVYSGDYTGMDII